MKRGSEERESVCRERERKRESERESERKIRERQIEGESVERLRESV